MYKEVLGIGTLVLVFILSMTLGLKMIDYHFPSKFDKLIHCNK